MNSTDIIQSLPYELAARIECDAFFKNVPVVVADEGNVEQEIKKLQAVSTSKGGKRGLAVVVLQMVADDESPEVAFGPMELKPALQVIEVVELNNTGTSARQAARRLVTVIKPCTFWGMTTAMKADRPCIEPVQLAKEYGDKIKIYQVNFACHENSEEQLQQVACPLFSQVAGDLPTAIITSATAGAAIWYTLDDTFPKPTTLDETSTAKLYTAPIPIPTDGSITVLRAIAQLDGMIDSDPNRAELTIQPS